MVFFINSGHRNYLLQIRCINVHSIVTVRNKFIPLGFGGTVKEEIPCNVIYNRFLKLRCRFEKISHTINDIVEIA